jgi:uncharacterized membrane protein
MQYTGPAQQAMPEATSGRPASWGPLVLLMVWAVIEGTACAFALRPTVSELLSDFVAFTVNPVVLIVVLSVFLTIIVAGSYACIQQLKDAIKAKHFGNILSMSMVQIVVAIFQVLFLYRPLVDAVNRWLAPQAIAIGPVGTYGLAICAWFAVRGMAWYLFARSGAPALSAVLNQSRTT